MEVYPSTRAGVSERGGANCMTKNTGKNIKAVVFDFGGVIELYEGGGHILKEVAKLLGISFEEFRNVYFQYNHLANVQNHKWEDMIIKAVSVFDDSKEKEREVRAAVRARMLQRRINTELLSFFPILKRLGLKVGIFSNANSELRERIKELELQDLADVIVISGEIGYQKPHKEAFQVLFEKLKLLPEEVVFIDDTARSLEKASEIGYIPILFKNNEQLKTELMDMGIQMVE